MFDETVFNRIAEQLKEQNRLLRELVELQKAAATPKVSIFPGLPVESPWPTIGPVYTGSPAVGYNEHEHKTVPFITGNADAFITGTADVFPYEADEKVVPMEANGKPWPFPKASDFMPDTHKQYARSY